MKNQISKKDVKTKVTLRDLDSQMSKILSLLHDREKPHNCKDYRKRVGSYVKPSYEFSKYRQNNKEVNSQQHIYPITKGIDTKHSKDVRKSKLNIKSDSGDVNIFNHVDAYLDRNISKELNDATTTIIDNSTLDSMFDALYKEAETFEPEVVEDELVGTNG